MKSISSAIIVSASLLLIGIGGFISHHETKIFTQLVGIVFGAISFKEWYSAIKSSED